MAKSKGKNTVTFAIMGLLILGLAGFGLTDFGGSVRSVATVGKTEVETNDYARAVQQQLQTLQRQSGQQMTFQQARAFGLDRIALGQLITSAALEDEARTIGLSVGDSTVGERIQQLGDFRNASGDFDRAIYEATLRQNGLNSGEFESDVRSDIAETLLQRAISAGVGTPDIFVDVFYNFARETRDVTWVRLGKDDLEAPIASPSDSDLAEYHAENAEAFTRPETKAITYAWLTPDMLVDEIEVADDQLRTLYDARIDEFVQPERRLVERLVYASEDQAKAAKDRLDAGDATFDALVDERGLELSDVDLGDVTQADLGGAGEAVFGLEDPGVVGPLMSDLGPALFRMNGVLAARETTFEDAKGDLRREAAQDRARRIILDSIPAVEDLLAGGADIGVLAERTDLQEAQIDWNTDVFEGVAAYAAFRAAATAANPGDFPEVIELEDGGILALSVGEVTPPELRPLDEVRAEVADAWTETRVEDALKAQAEALATQMAGGQSFADLGLSPTTSVGLDRAGFVEGTPPDFVTTVFEMDAGTFRTLSVDGDAWLVRLDGTALPDVTTPEAVAERAQFAAQTASEFSNGVTAAFSQALIEKIGVEINQAALNAVNTQLP